jgi:cyclic-di-GMP-binding protein
MLQFDLPELNSPSSPLFNTAQGCKTWIGALPLSNTLEAHRQLHDALEHLNRVPVIVMERLKILEVARETASYLQDEITKRFAGKAVPFKPVEHAAWADMVELWRVIEANYLRCFNDSQDNSETGTYLPLITQRCLRYVSLQMLGQGLGCVKVPKQLWNRLHALYRFSEQNEFATAKVKDSLDGTEKVSTCATTYLRALLLDAAIPAELSAKHLLLADQLLQQWAPRTLVKSTQPLSTGLPALAADLSLDAGLQPAPYKQDVPTLRYIDREALASHMKKIAKALQKGETVGSQSLPDGMGAAEYVLFIKQLYIKWCETSRLPITNFKSPSAALAQVCFSIPGLHYHMTGTPFRQPDRPSEMSRVEIEDIKVFGHVRKETQTAMVGSMAFNAETWHITGETLDRIQLLRPLECQTALTHGQLVGLRTNPASRIMIGQIKSLVSDEAGIQVVVQLLPGKPLPVAVREANLTHLSYTPAVLMIAATHEAKPSLLLPAGVHPIGKRMEVFAENIYIVRLESLVVRGADFEQVAFIAADSVVATTLQRPGEATQTKRIF